MLPVNPPIQYVKYTTHNGWQPIENRVIVEAPVSLTVNGETWLTFSCTPTQLEALAVGFLFNEGILQSMDEVTVVRACDNAKNVDVWLSHAVEKPSAWRRTSGCTGGLTRTQSAFSAPALPAGQPVSPAVLLNGMEQLFQAQELYRETRGVHCSALSDGERICLQAEDIGRHNTLDKLAGLLLLENAPPMAQRMVLTTGRISSEMLQKSARMGAAFVISRTSPTSLSVQAAEALGITLVGYARRNQFSVYTHPERLALEALQPAVPAGRPFANRPVQEPELRPGETPLGY